MPQKKRKTKKALSPRIGKGVDVGTAFVHCAQKIGPQVSFKTQRNAFFDIEYNEFTHSILEKGGVKYVLSGNKIYVVGDDSLRFANVFSKSTRRPMMSGVISPTENEALPIVELIIKSVLESPQERDEICYFAVPGEPADADFNTIYHQNVIKGFLEKWGYKPKLINEGLAVIFSELAEDNFTGMGISLGGGMANVCLAIMSMPVFSFSVAKAGDWIDEQVARVTNTPVSRITTFKESSFSLKKPETSMTKTEQALSIYHNYLIEYVLDEIKKEIARSTKIPKFEKPIPIVLSGGTASVPGFIERFKDILRKTSFPLEVREVKVAPHPLYTVSKGALIAAIADTKRKYG